MDEPDLQRRAFLRGRPSHNKTAIRPPWALPVNLFIKQCERCDDCRQACPEKIIIRGDGGYPEIDFTKGECTFCNQCVDSCSSAAFYTEAIKDNYNITRPWALQVRVLPSCLSINKVTCRTCGDHCDSGAIRFQIQVGGIAKPIIQNDHCTACGACAYTCPNQSIEIKNID